MVQVYFLLVLTNIFAGLTLADEFLKEKLPSLSVVLDLLAGGAWRMTLGIITFLVGFLGLISVLPGDLPVLGNLLIAFAGLTQGTGLVLEYYQSRAGEKGALVEKLDGFILKNRAIVGLSGLGLALLHFLFPAVLFL